LSLFPLPLFLLFPDPSNDLSRDQPGGVHSLVNLQNGYFFFSRTKNKLNYASLRCISRSGMTCPLTWVLPLLQVGPGSLDFILHRHLNLSLHLTHTQHTTNSDNVGMDYSEFNILSCRSGSKGGQRMESNGDHSLVFRACPIYRTTIHSGDR
jgi:hypothetical protein